MPFFKKRKLRKKILREGEDGIGVYSTGRKFGESPDTFGATIGNTFEATFWFQDKEQNVNHVTRRGYHRDDILAMQHMDVFPIKFIGKDAVIPKSVYKEFYRLNPQRNYRIGGLIWERGFAPGREIVNPFFTKSEVRRHRKMPAPKDDPKDDTLFAVLDKISICSSKADMIAIYEKHKIEFNEKDNRFLLEQIELFVKK